MHLVLSASGQRSREHRVVEVTDLQAARQLLLSWEGDFARRCGSTAVFGVFHGLVFSESGRLDGMFAASKRYNDVSTSEFPERLRKVSLTDSRLDNVDAVTAKA